jgi:hypothetical protein
MYHYADKIKENEVNGACSTHWRVEKSVMFLVGKSEGRRQFGRPKRRWEDGFIMDLRYTVKDTVN